MTCELCGEEGGVNTITLPDSSGEEEFIRACASCRQLLEPEIEEPKDDRPLGLMGVGGVIAAFVGIMFICMGYEQTGFKSTASSFVGAACIGLFCADCVVLSAAGAVRGAIATTLAGLVVIVSIGEGHAQYRERLITSKAEQRIEEAKK